MRLVGLLILIALIWLFDKWFYKKLKARDELMEEKRKENHSAKTDENNSENNN
ncbi:hypothetical protein [Natranaerobius thermophilus]|uniref:Uncharacterized protein n=1 Tax=Natranaerobius thermophilus (strain ATCC BAA-1301 / DSM 18059 / JW/NM-WN-LF) TaxID=457570 RepID=B2A7E4_NATTJ|nr:hypothetical protein [Natranaerobius thermophilus]ACB85653.1 hypothetical protein Nther_2086 [Natranaerobius thermophilus JW/NM-WN-LF]